MNFKCRWGWRSALRIVATTLAFACIPLSQSQSFAHVGSQVGPAASEAAHPLTRDDLEAWLDGFLPYALKQGDIAGAVVLVLKDGHVLLKKGYGYADIANRRPMDPDRTILRVGSVSKTFTWTAAMQMVEQGKLDLDRDINEYLDFEIPPAFGKPITLRHLMTHTAGFAERAFRQAPEGVTPRTLGEYIRETPVPERIYPPGDTIAYSNYGSMLAGYLVERVSGEPFVTYVQRHILEPLGMSHSTFERPTPAALAADVSLSYDYASGEPDELEDEEEPSGDPSGHLITTASDISRFMLAHLQGGRYAEYQLLRPETIRLMHEPAAALTPSANGATLGFFQTDYNGRRVVTHPGDIMSFHADMELLPDENVGFFMAVNSNGTSSSVLGAGVALRAALFRSFMDRYFPLRQPPEEPTATTAKEHARLIAGEYRMSRRAAGNFMEAVDLLTRYFAVPMIVTAREDGTIETPAWLSFESGRPQRWREVAPFRWKEIDGPAYLDAKVEGGRVFAFVMSSVLPAWVNERVSPLRAASWNVPIFLAACGVLLITTLAWPLASIVRRYYGVRMQEPGVLESRGARLTRWAAAIGVLFLIGWIVLLGSGIYARVGAEPWIRLVQLIGVACLVGTGVAVWNAWLTVTRVRGVWPKIRSVVVALAMLELAWFSLSFHLLSFDLNY